MMSAFKDGVELVKFNYRYELLFESTSSESGEPEYIPVARFHSKKMLDDYIDYLKSKYPGMSYKVEKFRLEH